MPSSRHACSLVLAALHTLAHTANAAELNYQAPAACPDREEVSFRITRALGRPFEAAPPTRFDVAVEATPEGFGATLRIEPVESGPSGSHAAAGEVKERSLEAESCSQLIDAVSVAVVLALGTLEQGGPADIGDGADAPTPDESSATTVASNGVGTNGAARDGSKQPAARGRDATTLRPGVFIWMLGDVGSLPAAGLGTGLGAQLGWSSWRVRAHASALFEQHVELELPSAVAPGADLALVFGGVALCRSSEELQLDPWTLALCLGGELGRMSGRGSNVIPERSGGALWAAPVLDGSARLELGAGAALELLLGAALPVTRNPFIIDEIGSVHRASSVAGRGALGLSWNFR